MAVRVVYPPRPRRPRRPRRRVVTALVHAAAWAVVDHDSPAAGRAQAWVWFAVLFALALAVHR